MTVLRDETDLLMIPTSLEIKGIAPCRAKSVPVRLAPKVPLTVHLNNLVQQNTLTSHRELG